MTITSNNWGGRKLGDTSVASRYMNAGKLMGRRFAHVFSTRAPSGAHGVAILVDDDEQVTPGWKLTLSTEEGPRRVMVEVVSAPADVSRASIAGAGGALDVAASVMGDLAYEPDAPESLRQSQDAVDAARLSAEWTALQTLIAKWSAQRPVASSPVRRMPIILACAVTAAVVSVLMSSLLAKDEHHDRLPQVVPVALTDTAWGGMGGSGGIAAAALEEDVGFALTVRLPMGFARDMPKDGGPVVAGQAVPDSKGKCRGSEVRIGNACWRKSGDDLVDGKCPDDVFQWKGACYVPVLVGPRAAAAE